jgi:hypothetical protein
MSRHYRVPQSNDTEVDGLISEILENRSVDEDHTLSEGTVRLLTACKQKINNRTQLTPTERQKIEGIYAFMCR